MTDWLKRDPETELLIGPDGCHYQNEHQAAHYGLLKLCGCGCPEDAYNFCRDVLASFDRRGNRGLASGWINAEDAVENLIKERPADAAHVLSHLLTNLDLLEHGSSVGGSWLTKSGERIVDMEPVTEELMDEGS